MVLAMNNPDIDEKLVAESAAFSQDEYVIQEAIEEQRHKEKALVRRLDCFIMPVLMVINLISNLDRTNIGFASTQGMTREIHLKGNQLNVSFMTFLRVNFVDRANKNRRRSRSSMYSTFLPSYPRPFW